MREWVVCFHDGYGFNDLILFLEDLALGFVVMIPLFSLNVFHLLDLS